MPADLTGLYRAGPGHILVVERDGELEAHTLTGSTSLPAQRLSAAAVDHHLQAGRWQRPSPPPDARVVLALDEGAWPVLSTSLGAQDPLPCIRATTTPVGWAARLMWAQSGLAGDGAVVTASTRVELVDELHRRLLPAGWLLMEMSHA